MDNLQVNLDNFHVANLRCRHLSNTTLDGLDIIDPGNAVVQIEHCPNLTSVPQQFYNARMVQIIDCGSVEDYDNENI